MPEKEMSFWDHMDELHKRILISLVTILIIASEALIFADTILKVLLTPTGGHAVERVRLDGWFHDQVQDRLVYRHSRGLPALG
jgi:Sec-independent protein secretion pathway component TatC